MASTMGTLRSKAAVDERHTVPMIWNAAPDDLFYAKDVVDREDTVPVIRRNAALVDTI